ncbi:hypothetical protein [Neptunomonas japonica]|uniref:hypothetical protein n=1 Tax=Neptunomonas japonica TaxID=417574 RepID=UPI0004237CCA|nr:hypothetical protein [Neptunomonas japonica]
MASITTPYQDDYRVVPQLGAVDQPLRGWSAIVFCGFIHIVSIFPALGVAT